MSTDEKGQMSKSNGWIDTLIEKDEGQGARRQHLGRFFRSLLVTDLKSVTSKIGECGSKQAKTHTTFHSVCIKSHLSTKLSTSFGIYSLNV